MSQKRRSFDKHFKARIALEAIRGEKTIAEIAGEYEILPVQIHKWKKEALEGMSDLFEDKRTKKSKEVDSEKREAELYKQIGQLKVENDFLKKTSERLGL